MHYPALNAAATASISRQAEGEATPTPGVIILTGCLQQSRERYQLVAGLTGFQGGGGRGGKDCPLDLPGGGGGGGGGLGSEVRT